MLYQVSDEQTTQNVQDLDWSEGHRDLATLYIENVEHVLFHSPATISLFKISVSIL